ncbi:MAG: UbiA family prenyltransferase [bacterium]
MKNYIRSLFFAIRPFENFQHFLMGVAGFLYMGYTLGRIEISSVTLWGFFALFSFLSQVLSYNNYATFDKDLKDKEKKFDEKFKGININFLFFVSAVFFLLTIYSAWRIHYIFAVIFILLMLGWALYTHPAVMLKKGRFVPYILDMMTMPFLSMFGSYLASGCISFEAMLFSVFFGLMEVAGHINHMTMDYEVDRETGIRTISVRLGPKKTFIISLCFFGLSAIYFFVISFFNVFPLYIGIAYLPGFLLQLLVSVKILKRNFNYGFSRKFRTMYRLIYFIESAYVGFIFILASETIKFIK